tara:strand:- start:4 stop:174 length:171 start_codon:yes stop_codon:yes gene_type:complete
MVFRLNTVLLELSQTGVIFIILSINNFYERGKKAKKSQKRERIKNRIYLMINPDKK